MEALKRDFGYFSRGQWTGGAIKIKSSTGQRLADAADANADADADADTDVDVHFDVDVKQVRDLLTCPCFS